MKTQLVHATRLAAVCFALVLFVVAGSCGGGSGGGGGGGGDNGGGTEINFTQGALSAVPTWRPPAPAAARALALGPGPCSPGTINDPCTFNTRQLFQMQCRRPVSENVDYCPPGTPSRDQFTPSGPNDPTGGDPYQFTMQTLIGFIYHAQMYNSLVTSCSGDGYAPKTVTQDSYAAASSSGTPDPTRFILDQYGTYTCRSNHVSDTSKETRMISAVADGSYQTTLHTRYQYVAGTDPQTDFFQVDVSMNAGSPEFLAENFASAKPFASRLVLLVNLATHRFALKYYNPAQGNAPARSWAAAGVGGYDLTSGQPIPGYYYIHFQDGSELEKCVNNADGTFQADFTHCDQDLNHTQWSPENMKTYLGVPAASATRLQPYLNVFTDTSLAAPDGWTTAQDADQDLFWPASLN